MIELPQLQAAYYSGMTKDAMDPDLWKAFKRGLGMPNIAHLQEALMPIFRVCPSCKFMHFGSAPFIYSIEDGLPLCRCVRCVDDAETALASHNTFLHNFYKLLVPSRWILDRTRLHNPMVLQSTRLAFMRLIGAEFNAFSRMPVGCIGRLGIDKTPHDGLYMHRTHDCPHGKHRWPYSADSLTVYLTNIGPVCNTCARRSWVGGTDMMSNMIRQTKARLICEQFLYMLRKRGRATHVLFNMTDERPYEFPWPNWSTRSWEYLSDTLERFQ